MGISLTKETIVPATLTAALDRMERSMTDIEKLGPPRAVFDLDDTLVIGDVGEAVFACLLADGERLGLTWREYQLLCEKDTSEAYRTVVQAMKGLQVSNIEQAALRVAGQQSRVIELEGFQVPMPRPHPIMESFVRHLSHRGYEVCVISSSSQIAVRIICPLWFRVPECRSFGIVSVVEGGIVRVGLKEPVPIGMGKRSLYERFFGRDLPYVAGGNSFMDLAMLNMVHPNGLVIWVGDDRVSFEIMKAKISGSRQFRFIERPGPPVNVEKSHSHVAPMTLTSARTPSELQS